MRSAALLMWVLRSRLVCLLECAGAGDSGRSGEGSVVRLIILWIPSRVRTLVGGVRSCGFWGETAVGCLVDSR